MRILTPDRLLSLAEAAVSAPSADNHHMFRLQAQGDSLHSLGTRELLDAEPGRRVLSLISIFQTALLMLVIYGTLEATHHLLGWPVPYAAYRLDYLPQFGVLAVFLEKETWTIASARLAIHY